jgi:hypothetical protein
MKRHRIHFWQRWTVVTLLLASALGAVTPEFTLRFGATGNMITEKIIDMDPLDDVLAYELGYVIGALPGSAQDDFDMPKPIFPPPSGGPRQAPTFYFLADTRSLYKDFRPPSTSQSWEIRLDNMQTGDSVKLEWRLQEGRLEEGNFLSLKDLNRNEILVENMMTTRSYVFTDTNQTLLVLHTTRNHPPVARGDVAAMLRSDGTLRIPFARLLANDYDPDAGNTIDVIAVGTPVGGLGGGKGASDYGATSLDTVARVVTYTLPATLPADWDDRVSFSYTIQDSDSDPDTLHEATATVQVTVAAHVLVVPTSADIAAHPGLPFRVGYTLVHDGSLQSLELSFTLPRISLTPVVYWSYVSGSYTADAGTPAPIIAPGDDSGQLVLDFGTNVPPTGTHFSFALNAPAAAFDVTLLYSSAIYQLTGSSTELTQPLPEVAVRSAYTLTFVSAGNGTVTGAASQLLEPGHLSGRVTAEPATGYHFLRWTLGGAEIGTNTTLTFAGGNTDLTVTAWFAINTYTLTFGRTGAGVGTLTGATTQQVTYLGSATPVKAVPGTDSYFYQWIEDGSTANPRTVTGVTATATYTAEFRALTPGDPNGHFNLVFQNQTGGDLRSIWDLTGPYVANVGAHVLTLVLTYDERGTVGGVGQLQGSLGGQPFTVSGMPVRGSSSGRNGSLTVRGSLADANATTAASLKLSLALVGRTLTGVVTGSVTDRTTGTRLLISAPCVLNLPDDMTGAYQLPTDLTLGARGAISGTSTLILGNGRTVPLLVSGRRLGSQTTLTLTGDRTADPAFSAIRFTLTVRTYTDNLAGIRALAGEAFGQIFTWRP